jgi:hypothetical protein
MLYDTSYIETHPVFTCRAIILISVILVAAIFMAAFWMFEAHVERQAYDYGYEHTNSVLYSTPDVVPSRRAIQVFRALTDSTDPVYDACIERYPHEFVTEHLDELAKKLFRDEALEWVIDGIDDAFDEFLGERK